MLKLTWEHRYLFKIATSTQRQLVIPQLQHAIIIWLCRHTTLPWHCSALMGYHNGTFCLHSFFSSKRLILLLFICMFLCLCTCLLVHTEARRQICYPRSGVTRSCEMHNIGTRSRTTVLCKSCRQA